MTHQALFSLEDKSKRKLNCRLLRNLVGALRVNNFPRELFVSVRFTWDDDTITFLPRRLKIVITETTFFFYMTGHRNKF